MSNLLSVCTKCHTPANHKPGGKLYDLKPKVRPLNGAAFMNAVRWLMFSMLKSAHPDVEWHMTYGAATQEAGKVLCLDKSHANDAYAMGRLHPKHRTPFMHFRKLRRNNRILEKFYDAKYTDARDEKKERFRAVLRTNESKRVKAFREKSSHIQRAEGFKGQTCDQKKTLHNTSR